MEQRHGFDSDARNLVSVRYILCCVARCARVDVASDLSLEPGAGRRSEAVRGRRGERRGRRRLFW